MQNVISCKRANGALQRIQRITKLAGLATPLFHALTRGNLTNNSLVTADSVYNNGSEPAFILAGLTDGKFDASRCTIESPCAHNNNSTNQPWFSIKMSAKPCVVRSVIVINREDCCYSRSQGMDLSVSKSEGYPSDASKCTGQVNGTGVYDCQGKVGTHLGISKASSGEYINLVEIRAYSYTLNGYKSYTLSQSSTLSPCPYRPDDFVNGPIHSGGGFTALCTSYPTEKSVIYTRGDVFWQKIQFASLRFVQTVTIIGTDGNSNEWMVGVIENSGQDQYKVSKSIFGGEFTFGVMAQAVLVSSVSQTFKFRGILLSTTDQECNLISQFNWTTDFPTNIFKSETLAPSSPYTFKASLGTSECAVAHEISSQEVNQQGAWVDQSALPNFFTYNAQTQQLTINALTATNGLYKLKNTAYRNDKIASFLENSLEKEILVCTFDWSLSQITWTTNINTGQTVSGTVRALLDCGPKTLPIVYQLLIGSQVASYNASTYTLTLSPTAATTTGTHEVRITATISNASTNLTKTITWTKIFTILRMEFEQSSLDVTYVAGTQKYFQLPKLINLPNDQGNVRFTYTQDGLTISQQYVSQGSTLQGYFQSSLIGPFKNVMVTAAETTTGVQATLTLNFYECTPRLSELVAFDGGVVGPALASSGGTYGPVTVSIYGSSKDFRWAVSNNAICGTFTASQVTNNNAQIVFSQVGAAISTQGKMTISAQSNASPSSLTYQINIVLTTGFYAQSTFSLQITIVECQPLTLDAKSSISDASQEVRSGLGTFNIQFPSYQFAPCNSVPTSISFAAVRVSGANFQSLPSFMSVQNVNNFANLVIQLSNSSYAGTYKIKITATGTKNGVTLTNDSVTFTVTLYSCSLTNVVLTPGSPVVLTIDSAVTINWTANALDQGCGSFSVVTQTAQSSTNYIEIVSGSTNQQFQLKAYSGFSPLDQNFEVPVQIKRNNLVTQLLTQQLAVIVNYSTTYCSSQSFNWTAPVGLKKEIYKVDAANIEVNVLATVTNCSVVNKAYKSFNSGAQSELPSTKADIVYDNSYRLQISPRNLAVGDYVIKVEAYLKYSTSTRSEWSYSFRVTCFDWSTSTKFWPPRIPIGAKVEGILKATSQCSSSSAPTMYFLNTSQPSIAQYDTDQGRLTIQGTTAGSYFVVIIAQGIEQNERKKIYFEVYQEEHGALVQDGIVTVDSSYQNESNTWCETDHGQCYGISGLNSGRFNPKDFTDLDHLIARNDGSSTSPAWFNIKMNDNPCIVWSVIVINQEECQSTLSNCQNFIIGMDLYVGYNQIATQNTSCNQLPQSSGVFSCNGRVGTYLGIGKPAGGVINIAQIRAYSYTFLSYDVDGISSKYSYGNKMITPTYGLSYLSCISESCSKNYQSSNLNPLTFNNGALTTDVNVPYPSLTSGTGSNSANEFVGHLISLSSSRYIQTVTLIGAAGTSDPALQFKKSRNWSLYVSNASAITDISTSDIVRTYVEDSDKYGREIIVKRLAKFILVKRDDDNFAEGLQLRQFLVTSTANDCTNNFAWNNDATNANYPNSLYIRISKSAITETQSRLVKATLSDCAVAHRATIPSNASSFITYNDHTNYFQITTGPTTIQGFYSAQITAYMNDRVTASKFETKEVIIEVFQSTVLAATQQYVDFVGGEELTFDFNTVMPNPIDAYTLLSYTLSGQPGWLTLVDNTAYSPNLTNIASHTYNKQRGFINQSSQMGVYHIQVTATDQISGQSVTYNVMLRDCKPRDVQLSISLTQQFVSITILGVGQTISWSMNEQYAECGTSYQAIGQITPNYTIMTQSTDRNIYISAPQNTTTVGTYNTQLVVRRTDSNLAQTSTSVGLTIQVLPCVALSVEYWQGTMQNQTLEINEQYADLRVQLPVYKTTPCWFLLPLTLEIIDENSQPASGVIVQPTADNPGTFGIVLNNPIYKGTYNFAVRATEPVSNRSVTSNNFSMLLYYCQPTGIEFNPSSPSISIAGSAASVTWSKAESSIYCGSYSASVYGTIPQGISTSVSSTNNAIAIQANLDGSAVGSYSQTYKIKRDANPNQFSIVTMNFTVTECVPTSISQPNPDDHSFEVAVGKPDQTVAFTNFTITPCGQNYQYTRTVVSSTSGQPVPSFIEQTSGGDSFIVKCDNPANAGTYNLKIIAVAGTLTQLSQTFTITLHDCMPKNILFQSNGNNVTSLSISILGNSSSVRQTQTPSESINSFCGYYYPSFDSTEPNYTASKQSSDITVSAASTAVIGTYTLHVKVIRRNDTNQYAFADLTIVVQACVPTSIAVDSSTQISNITYEVGTGLPDQTVNFPSFTISPCGSLSSYTRTVKKYDLSNAPDYIVQTANSSSFQVKCADSSIAGTTNFKIVASTQNGLTAYSNQFQITLYSCKPTGLGFSSSNVSINVLGTQTSVTWNKATTNGQCGSYQASVASEVPSWLIIQISGQTITIQAPDNGTVGLQSVTIKVERSTTEYTDQFETITLPINVYQCRPESIAFNSSTAVASQTFETDVGNADIFVDLPTFTVLPCQRAELYTYIRRVKYQDQVNVTLPDFIEQPTDDSKMFAIKRNNPSFADTYSLVVYAQAGSYYTYSNEFTVVLYSCTPSGLHLSSTSVSVNILGQAMTVTWSVDSRNESCGTYTTTTESSLVLITGNILTISADTSVSVGTHTATITIHRDSNQTQVMSGTLTIYVNPCIVTSLVLSRVPDQLTFVFGLDTQPMASGVTTHQTPACNNQVSFSLYSMNLGYLSVPATSFSDANLTISNAQRSDHTASPLAVTLRASVDGRYAEATFQLKITDPCSSAQFVVDESQLETMKVQPSFYVVPFTQSFGLTTDDEYGFACPFVTHMILGSTTSSCAVTYWESNTNKFWSVSDKTVLLDYTKIESGFPCVIGNYTFQIEATSAQFPDAARTAIFQLPVEVTCTPFTIFGSIPDQELVIVANSTITSLSVPAFKYNNCDGNGAQTITVELKQVNKTTLSNFISLSGDKQMVQIDQGKDVATAGVYEFVIIATAGTNSNNEVNFTVTFVCPFTSIKAVTFIQDVKYTILPGQPAQTVTIPLPVYSALPSYCVPRYGYDIISDNPPKTDHFLSYTKTAIIINTEDSNLDGTYKFTVKVHELASGVIDESVKFTVYIVGKCIIKSLKPIDLAQYQTSIKYAFRTAPLALSLPKYEYLPTQCVTTLKYSLKNLTDGALSTFLPSFLVFDATTNKISITGSSSNYVDKGQSFSFQLVVTADDGNGGTIMNSDYSFTINTSFQNSPPLLASALEKRVVKIPEALTWGLPDIKDPEGDEITSVLVKGLGTKPWLNYEPSARTFKATTEALKASDAGTFSVDIEVTDVYAGHAKFTQVVVVEAPDPVMAQNSTDTELASNSTSTEPDSTDLASNSTETEAASNSTDTASNSTDVEGLDSSNSDESANGTETSQSEQLNRENVDSASSSIQTGSQATSQGGTQSNPAFTFNPWDKKQPSNPNANKSSEKKKEVQLVPIKLQVSEIGDNGILTLNFNRPVKFNPKTIAKVLAKPGTRRLQALDQQNFEELKKVIQAAFVIRYQSSSDETDLKAQLLGFTVLSFDKEQEIKIQLEFNEPLLVSVNGKAGSFMDNLNVSFKDKSLFLDSATDQPIPADIFLDRKVTLPKQQASAAQAAVIKGVLETSQNVVAAVVPGNLVLSIFFGMSLKKVWGAYNMLQILIYLQLWALTLPANTIKFINYVEYLIRLEFIPKDKIINFVMKRVGIKETTDPQKLYTALMIIAAIVVVLLGASIVLLVYLFKKNATVRYYVIYVKKMLFWNTFLRTWIQMYLDTCMTFNLKIAAAFAASSVTKKEGSFVLALLVMFIVPFIIYRQLVKHIKILGKEDIKEKYGTLYTALEYNDSGALSYNLMFCLRRFVFAAITAFWARKTSPYAIIVIAYLHIAVQCYLCHVQPLDAFSADMIELVSEILIHYVFLSFIFAELQFSPVSKYRAGWASVVLICTLVTIHVVYMCYELVPKTIKEAKYYWAEFKFWRRATPFDYAAKADREMLVRFKEETNEIRQGKINRQTQNRTKRLKWVRSILLGDAIPVEANDAPQTTLGNLLPGQVDTSIKEGLDFNQPFKQIRPKLEAQEDSVEIDALEFDFLREPSGPLLRIQDSEIFNSQDDFVRSTKSKQSVDSVKSIMKDRQEGDNAQKIRIEVKKPSLSERQAQLNARTISEIIDRNSASEESKLSVSLGDDNMQQQVEISSQFDAIKVLNELTKSPKSSIKSPPSWLENAPQWLAEAHKQPKTKEIVTIYTAHNRHSQQPTQKKHV